mgnify:CR=1 FL=1
MGNTNETAKQKHERDLKFEEDLLTTWYDFLEFCCIFDENEYTSYNDLSALFAHYHKKKDIVTSDFLEALVINENKRSQRKLQITPGTYTTALVLGIKVVRFNKKNMELCHTIGW